MLVPKLLFGYPIDRSSCFIPFNTGCAALPALVWKLELPGMRSQTGIWERAKPAGMTELQAVQIVIPECSRRRSKLFTSTY